MMVFIFQQTAGLTGLRLHLTANQLIHLLFTEIQYLPEHTVFIHQQITARVGIRQLWLAEIFMLLQ